MSGKIRILLADDHAEFRRAIRLYLKRHENIEVVGEAGTGSEVISRADGLHPDIILMDINMPGVSGLEAARVIKRTRPETMVVFLTMHAEERYRQLAADCSADGFIDKADLNMNIFHTISNKMTSCYIM